MADQLITEDFRTILSIEPLLDFWRTQLVPRCSQMADLFRGLEERIGKISKLQGEITDPDLLVQHTDILRPLMSVAFPPSTWETELTGAFMPFTHHMFYSTPTYQKLLLDDQGQIAGQLKSMEKGDMQFNRLARAYALILERIYGIDQGLDSPFIRIITNPETGLQRYFQINPDFQFVQVGTVGKPHELSSRQRQRIIEKIVEPDELVALLPPEQFEFRGFTVVRAVDVTESEVISALERDLIDQESIFSADGFRRLQNRLRNLFGKPELKAGLGAAQGDQVLVLDDGHHSTINCLFRNSRHIPMDDLKGSVWLKALEQEEILRIPDLSKKPDLCLPEENAVQAGVRSMLIAPLRFGGKPIGTFHVKTDQPNELGAVDAERMSHIVPLFSMALKRGLDDMNNEVQAIIKEKCTAVHPSVEWRFQQVALNHMEQLRRGEASEMPPIVFKNVIPLFGQSDIRGSSEARVRSIQADLKLQLTLAANIIDRAAEAKSWPLLDEISYRIQKRITRIQTGLSTEEESDTAVFLQQEVEQTFADLLAINPGVGRAIDAYQKAVDPDMGVVYHKRKAFEESVSLLNERLSSYLEQQQTEAQKVFPHYFEKHESDGIDYVIYLGASMHQQGQLNPFFLKNLALWQFIVTCGLAWHSQQIQPELNIPLNTCHLILVNRTPLSIRFRYDEKRFGVDGAYDVRYEIIKSRLDKAMVKGGRERLTQPGQIAVVYSHPKEGQEILQHIDYLKSRGYLLADVEQIELDDLPGVRGLKALRVGVNLQAETVPQGIRQVG